jgi:hypothetical protein
MHLLMRWRWYDTLIPAAAYTLFLCVVALATAVGVAR